MLNIVSMVNTPQYKSWFSVMLVIYVANIDVSRFEFAYFIVFVIPFHPVYHVVSLL